MIADSHEIEGLICLGYPFHPPGKPEKLRTEHLKTLECRTLILQGERDPFGKHDEVNGYELSEHIAVEWIPDGEHSFKPRKSSGTTQEANLELASQHIRRFILELPLGLKTSGQFVFINGGAHRLIRSKANHCCDLWPCLQCRLD